MPMPNHKEFVLSNCRQLFRLIQRLPAGQRAAAQKEAIETIRERSRITNNEQTLSHLKELAAKIAYLRVITPRQPGGAFSGSTSYVLRDGVWVEGKAQSSDTRVASSTITMSEAMERNNRDFKRFYGADKPKEVFF